MIPFRKTLAFRLLGISIILLALPLFVDSFIIVQSGFKDALKDAKGELVEIAHQRELPLSEMQPVKRPFMVMMEHFLGLRKSFPEEKNSEIDAKLKKMAAVGDFYGIYLMKITPKGRYIVVSASDPSYEGRDYTDFFKLYDLYSPGAYERGFVNYISYDNESGLPYFVVARVVYAEKTGEPVGLIAVSSQITDKLEKLLAPDKEKYTAYFALLLPEMIAIASSDPSFRFQFLAPLDPKRRRLLEEEEPLAKKLLPDKPLKTDSSIGYPFFEFVWKGEKQIGFIHKLPSSELSLLVYASKESIYTAPFESFGNIYGIYALILVIGGVAAYLLTRWMGRPFRQLSKVMDSIEHGDLEARYRQDRVGYEINALGSIFNEMVDTLIQKKSLAEEERVKRETYAEELRIGQKVQRSLLPVKMPRYPGVELSEVYIPAKEVGGDFYDVYVKTKENRDELVLTIADASGKGVSACFYSLDVRSMLRTYALEYSDVGKILEETNHLFCIDTGETGMFVTALMGIYYHQSRELRYYSCGHNPPYVRRKDGSLEKLNHMGIALGLDFDQRGAQEKRISLEKGDLLLFYTDGVTEAQNSSHALFGEERLEAFLKREGDKEAAEISHRLVEEINAFVGEAPQHDDITLLVMKVVA